MTATINAKIGKLKMVTVTLIFCLEPCHNSEQVKQKAPSLGSILRNRLKKRPHTCKFTNLVDGLKF